MTTELHLKYRPSELKQIIGHVSIVKSLTAVLKKRAQRSFLFTGPEGLGKTTFARIIAKVVGCESQNFTEVDAASHSGVDAMRALTSALAYVPLGESKARVLVIDECHALSTQAWQSLLKVTEEPPGECYWVFCTTQPQKVPKTIHSRCARYQLQPLPRDEIYEILEYVIEKEKMKVDDDVLALVVKKSNGLPRWALTYLAMCESCISREEALEVLSTVDAGGDIIEIPRALVAGKLTWDKLVKMLKKVGEQNAESIRLVTLAYLTTVLMNTKSDESATRILAIMEAFSQSYNSSEGMAPLLLSFGDVLYSV